MGPHLGNNLVNLGVLEHRLRHRAEDHAGLRQLVLEGRDDADAVEHRVDRDARQALLLVERDAELLVRLEQLGIDAGTARSGGLVGHGRDLMSRVER